MTLHWQTSQMSLLEMQSLLPKILLKYLERPPEQTLDLPDWMLVLLVA
jgi:hypothetical protein